MSNPYYNHGTVPVTLSPGVSSLVRAEFDAVTTGFDKLPTLAANNNKALVINSGGTAITVTTGTLSLAGNFTLQGAFNTTFVQQASVTLTLPSISGELVGVVGVNGNLWGLRLANNGSDATNDIDIYLGRASSTNGIFNNIVTLVNSTDPLTKRLDATWVTGTNNGGRSSSVALSNTTYHVFLIRVGGVDDVGFDTSINATNLIADHAVTAYRRIGSIMREGGAIVPFLQVGDYFYRNVPIQSVSTTNPGTSGITATLHVPTGLSSIQAIVVSYITDATPTVVKYLLLTSTDQTDTTPAESASTLVLGANSSVSSSMDYVKAVSAQIRYRISVSDADIAVKLNTHGWIDGRGVTDLFPG